jgi:serine beta-lactamase-like protein LACTB
MITQKIKLQNKRAITLLVITIIGVFTFKIFEPIFVYNFGWEEFARTQSPPITSEQNSDKWDAQSKKSAEALNEFYENIDTPAVSIAVAVDGELAWRGAIGFANLANQQAISFDDAFRLGSTSKAITSVAIATLVDQKVWNSI